MKNRMSRSHKARIDFKVDNLLGHKQHCVGVGNGKLVIPRSSFSNASKNASGFFHCSGPIKYYNIILLGISDGQMCKQTDYKKQFNVVFQTQIDNC